MSASKLIKPDPEYKDSYINALKEFHAEGRLGYYQISKLEEDFLGFLANINEARKENHPCQDWEEWVPETVLWLVKDYQYVGTVNIRHRLNWHLERYGGHINFKIRPSWRGQGFGKKILKKSLPYAEYLGIENALLTVTPDNIAAIKTIEACGGEFRDEAAETDWIPARKRYWIKTGQ